MEIKVIFSIIFLVFMTSLASAGIIITQQPNGLYNLGDSISVPATVKSTTELSGSFQMDLICNGKTLDFYKNGISLKVGEEKKIDASLVLTKQAIGEMRGACTIKSSLGTDYALTNEFKISDLIMLNLKTEQKEFNPEENVIIEGDAIRDNGNNADGFIDLSLVFDSGNVTTNQTYQGTINNGYFRIEFTIPKEMKAGQYSLKLNAYEKDSLGEKTNKGVADYNILVRQIPTSLEIVFENSEVNPGENMKVETILHDQTGEKIDSVVVLTVKDEKSKIHEQVEKTTGEFLEFPINYKEPPSEWTVVAISNKLTSQSTFRIVEKEEALIEIINRTIIITNVGNVPYNKTLLVKVGSESFNLNPYLEIDEKKKYSLNAPDGEYHVEIIDEGESQFTKEIFLTGKSVSIKEVSEGILKLTRYPLAWIFVIIILGFVAFMFFRKGYKKSFFGYISKMRRENKVALPISKHSLLESSNKAELSLSLKGEKQSASMVCVKIKNLRSMGGKESSTEETLQKIINLVGENKGFVYENGDNLFFVFAPMLTKTFKNEMTALNVAEKTKEMLAGHNKMFKQKLQFGIALIHGDIIAKKEDVIKFMSFGAFITSGKKISSISDGEIYLNEKMKEKLMSNVRTERQTKDGIEVYVIKEIRDKGDHKKFIGEFMKRLEKG